MEAWCRKGGSWGCFDLPCSAARPSHAPILLWRSPSPILRERGPVWRARCLPSPQEASVKDWPQGVRGWPSQGWVAHVATERQFHHVLRTPCPGLAGSPRGFSESIACFGSEHRGRWRSGEGAAMLDCIPGALGTAPPGALRPLSEHLRDWQLNYFCSFGSLNLLPSECRKNAVNIRKMPEAGYGTRGCLRPLCDTE